MAETRVTATVTIPAPPERVWELLSDTRRYAEWVEGTDEVTRTDGAAREGSTYDEVNPLVGPWRATTQWNVEQFDPPRRQVHRGRGIPLTRAFVVEMEVRPAGDGSEVTQTLRAEPAAGPLGAAFHRLMRGQVERDTRKSMENLAALARRELGQPAAA
jgi:carbon monoxide dehydrogenase subunit G